MTSRTVVCRTEASDTKVERLRPFIEEWQYVAREVCNRMPSFPESRWGNTKWTTLYRTSTNIVDDPINYADTLSQAGKKVTEAYGSWNELQHGDANRPRVGSGDVEYLRLRDGRVEIIENKRGYGVKVNIEPYGDPLWLHLCSSEYHETYFDRVLDDDDSAFVGCTELRVADDDEIYVHMAVSYDQPVMSVDDAEHYVGVDMGERAVYAVTAVDDGGDIVAQDVEPGKEFRHHRNEITRRMDRVKARGDLSGLKNRLSGQRERYTDQMTHVYANNIVNLARDVSNPVIIVEDLTGHRETMSDPIHDWPNLQLRQKIAYKAEDHGIPVTEINPAYTSQECNKCGHASEDNRAGIEFSCQECGYQSHADFNASVNIANRYRKA